MPSSKKSQIWCGFIILVLATIALGAGVIYAIMKSDSDKEASKCAEKHCKDLAKEFLSNMDTSVDPCDNFYKFACGNYRRHNPLKDQVSISPSSKISNEVQRQLREILEEPIRDGELNIFKNAKRYYKACSNTAKIEKVGLEKVKKMLDSLGGWPVVHDDHPNLNWTSLLYKMKDFGMDVNHLLHFDVELQFKDASRLVQLYKMKDFGMDVNHLLHFDVELQFKDASRRTLMFSPPLTPANIPPEEFSKGKGSSAIVGAFYNFTVELARLFGANREVAEKDMEDVLNLEIELCKASKTLEQLMEDPAALENRFTIYGLEKEFPNFPWYDYINKLTPKNLTIPKSEEVGISELEYTRFLIQKLQETPQRVLRNLLIMRALIVLVPFLNEETRMLQRNTIGPISGGERWKECVFRVHFNLPIFVNALYAQKYFNPTSKALVTGLINYIKKQYKEILNSTNWSPEDKKFAQEKIDYLYLVAGSPDELLDLKMLEEINADLEIYEDDYLQSELNIKREMYEEQFHELHLRKNRNSWKDYAGITTVNAYYSIEQNSFFLPAATLQGIYFDSRHPNYTNFGAIGATIGHELSHAFDNVGHKVDKNGGLTGNWSEMSNQEFTERETCVINQYRQYSFEGHKLNGLKTIRENLADLNGYNAAYLSYQRWLIENGEEAGLPSMDYNNNQLFWISSANKWCNSARPESVIRGISSYTHAPNEFRVVGPLSNLDMFAKDFNCPIGSNMNPKYKCIPW